MNKSERPQQIIVCAANLYIPTNLIMCAILNQESLVDAYRDCHGED